MILSKKIKELRMSADLSQDEFAGLFGVEQQTVKTWENGECFPELHQIIRISKHFGVSLDDLVFGTDNSMADALKTNDRIEPQYNNLNEWEYYASNLMTEYEQSIDEGLDIERYKELFSVVSGLEDCEAKVRFADILFEIVSSAEIKKIYPFNEPSDLSEIRKLRKAYSYNKKSSGASENKILGAWMGRVCGCMLGKTLEGIRTDELIPFLKETGNFPLTRYVLQSDLNEDILNKYKYDFRNKCFADTIDGMPVDDDTNYTVLYQEIIEKYGNDFTSCDVAAAWLDYQSKNAYFTAERVSYCNFINGFVPPESAKYKNPFREWIGAQIRADYFGYINPGNPEKAAEMAWRDASISHTKNGIYGEMLVAAMLAAAAETDDIFDIIYAGLAEIPYTSRLYKAISSVCDGYKNGVTSEECFKHIHSEFDEYTGHGWCHTISNAMIVVAALLYGNSDFGRSICMAVEAGFDTDCNGATVGSILGMANGIESVPEYWSKPINDTLHTSIFGIDTVKISERVKLTLEHICNNDI